MEENQNLNSGNEEKPLNDASTDINESDDAFIIGKGFSVAEPESTTTRPASHSKKKRDKKHGPAYYVIWISAIIIVSCSIAFGAIYIGADFFGMAFGRTGEKITIDIPSGSSAQKIAETLKENGIVKCPTVFRLYSKLRHYDSKFKYGVYTFVDDSGYDSIAQKLMTEGAQAETAEVRIPEMATVDDIAKLLEDGRVCSKSDFYEEVQNGKFNFDFIDKIPTAAVHYRLEGYLYPETYKFYSYDSKECAHLAVQKMLETFDSRLGDLKEAYSSNAKYDFHQLVTLASLINSEAGNATDEDRSRVAQVFYNRLEGINWNEPKYLQTDPSTKYPYGAGRYNTYKTEGLPPGPIGSPSAASLKAAVNPETGFKATYFVTDSDGKFYFNETLAAHNKTISDLKKAGKWTYTTLG